MALVLMILVKACDSGFDDLVKSDKGLLFWF